MIFDSQIIDSGTKKNLAKFIAPVLLATLVGTAPLKTDYEMLEEIYGDNDWILPSGDNFMMNGETEVSQKNLEESPEWTEEVIGKIWNFQKLPANWDSYGGLPIDYEPSVICCYVIRKALSRAGVPKPSVVPTSEGGVQVEWHIAGIDLEIEFSPPNKVIVYWEDTSGLHENYYEFPFDLEILKNLVDRLSARFRQMRIHESRRRNLNAGRRI